MLLSDYDLRNLQNQYQLVQPFDEAYLQPASYDLHWGGSARWMIKGLGPLPTTTPLDNIFHQREEHTDHVMVLPDDFVLISTYESVNIPNGYAARVEGKSSLGRLGLSIHTTAGFIDPGFYGQITLEVSNNSPNPLIITPNQKIAQLCVFQVSGYSQRPYGTEGLNSAYQGQHGPTVSLGVR